MMASKTLGVCGGVTLAAVLFAACSTGDAGGGTGGGDTSSSGPGAVVSSSSTTGSSSASATTSTGTSSTSSTGSGGTMMCADVYSDVPIGECDLWQQNCMPGYACRPVQAGGSYTTQCVMSSGLKGQATACAAPDECAAGLFCVFSKCTPVCCPSDPNACGGGTCNVDVTIGSYFMRVCAFPQSCTLFMPGACPAGEECHLSDPMQGLAVCIGPSGQQVNEGEMCMYLNDCHDAQMCLTEMGSGVCRYNCDLTNWQTLQPGLGGCPAGRTCQNVGFMPPNIGVCRP